MERELAPNLIGTSKPFREVVAAAKEIAEHDTPVLITGETGTGKEEIAKLKSFLSEHEVIRDMADYGKLAGFEQSN